MLKIVIGQISASGSSFSGEMPSSILELDDESSFRAHKPIFFDFFLQVISMELIVNGKVTTEIELVCSRCGEFFSTSIQLSSFLRAYELTPTTDVVDITEGIREEILLEIPGFPLCATTCKGRCPHCGVNRNQERCVCAPTDEHGVWNDLNQLNLDEDHNDLNRA